jgi:hypothetical protein
MLLHRTGFSHTKAQRRRKGAKYFRRLCISLRLCVKLLCFLALRQIYSAHL